MDINLNVIQKDIAKEARRFLESECPMEYVREMFEDERGFSQDIWAKMAKMNWIGIRIPELYGGMGLEQTDLNVLLEEMGRAMLPGPFFSTVQLAGETIIAVGSASQKEYYLSGIGEGAIKGTLALHEPDGGSDPSYIQMEALRDGNGFVLNGTKLVVSDAHVANILVCAARTEHGYDSFHGITLFLVDLPADGVTVSTLPTMDCTRKYCAVDFKRLKLGSEKVLGELHKGRGVLNQILQRAQVGLSADCVGGAQRAMEIATNYAKIRIQFDQPIGAFQAIKHRCAQMYVEVESSRSVLYWAAWAQDHGDLHEAAIAASAAKAYCSEAYRNVSTSAIQVLGGTGITWDNDAHLYLKRAKANEVALGDPIYHRERVVKLLTA